MTKTQTYYTCINDDTELIETRDGWECPLCGCYTIAPEEDGMNPQTRSIEEGQYMTEKQQVVLRKIAELDKKNISIAEANSMLAPWLIEALPKKIQEAYYKMISNMIPF